MEDRRVAKTRSALELSFDRLLLAGGYDRATPARVAQVAEVGRSTFYEYFSGRDDLLGRRLSIVLQPLADAVCSPTILTQLEQALRHFWSNRVMARALLTGRARIVAMRTLTALIERRISGSDGMRKPGSLSRLTAAHIAAGQLAMLEEWLSGRRHCPTDILASGLHASSRAVASAMAKLPNQTEIAPQLCPPG